MRGTTKNNNGWFSGVVNEALPFLGKASKVKAGTGALALKAALDN